MFQVSVEDTFSSGHALRGYKGKCENVHGHNYRVMVTIQGEQLDATGLLVDFVDIKRLMGGAIDYLDHRFINDLAPFDEINPSAENIAKYFYDQTNRQLDGMTQGRVRVKDCTIWETDTTTATYYE